MIPTHRRLRAIARLWSWGLLSTEEAARAIQARIEVTDLGGRGHAQASAAAHAEGLAE